MYRKRGTGSITVWGYKVHVVNGKTIREHVAIAENHLGRKLQPNEVVHHINHDKLDNRIENLIVVTRSWHKRIHSEIGLATRFQKIHKFSDKVAYDAVKNLGSQCNAAKALGCNQATISRSVKRYLNKEVQNA